MSRERLKPPSLGSVRDHYNCSPSILLQDDPWHSYARSQVAEFVRLSLEDQQPLKERSILNAGSGGNSFQLLSQRHYHVDIANRFLDRGKSAVADVQQLPFRDATFDVAICVGSVINYCDAAQVINELSRTLKSAGLLVLEFERSSTLEFLFTPAFGKNSHLVKTFYNGEDQCIWVYSEEYITNLLKTFNFEIRRSRRFHILSPFALRLKAPLSAAAKWARADDALRKLEPLSRLACNSIFLAEKIE